MNYNKGFTLVELMVTLAMTGIIVAAVYSTYTLQQKTYTSQDQVTEMQQNIRAGIDIMVREIRMAGYDPPANTNDSSCSAGGTGPATAPTIHSASLDSVGLSMDYNEDGDCGDSGEELSFALQDDADNNGIADSGVSSLGRRDRGSGLQAIADNIQSIEFYYKLADGTELLTPTSAQLPDIRSLQISILARARVRDPKYMNATTYTTASGATWGPDNDNFRRRMFVTTVQCRNMGL